MTQNLGKYNDLYQLILSLGYKYNSTKNPAFHELVIMIRNRQDKHLYEVWTYANRVFGPGKKLLNVLGYKVILL